MRSPHFLYALPLFFAPALFFVQSTAEAGKSKSPIAAKTVAVAPFTTGSGPEYGWIGPAMADALALRVHKQPGLSGLSLRQVNSAMRHDGLVAEDLQEDFRAIELGRQLGANVLLTGRYRASWPDIELIVKAYDPQTRKLISTHPISGGLDDLVGLEARIAKVMAQALGAKNPNVLPGAFGTQNLRAWRLTTLALGVLNYQSLSPRAADPSAPLKLLPAAINQARQQLMEATGHDADYGEAWAALGIAQSLGGDNKMAWRSLGKATALGFGHHPTAILGASFVRMREGNYDAAASILTKAIDRHPGFLHARGYLGELYNHQGRHREALKTFEDYLVRVPAQPWILAQRGYTKSKLRNHNGAIADTIAAVDILPDSPSLLLQLAGRYIDAGKLIGAEDALLHATKKHPEAAPAYVRLGYVYLLQGKDEMVVPITERALRTANFGTRRRDRVYAHLNLVRAYGRLGRIDQAIEHLGKAKELGIVSLDELDVDEKLKALHRDPRYKKLMN